MRVNTNLKLGRVALLLGGASALSLAIGSAAFAQDATMETVIVTGVRASLQSAQSIKQNADTVVDSITATDIGALPDKSVAEALKRVPGVNISLFASAGDTSHFSAEPSTVIIRGLQQVRSEFNGRDVFGADSSRGLSFADVSPELMAGVDTYKNQTADLIEGGIAGSINLRTRTPFDSDGEVITATGRLNWGTLAQKITPDLSGLYSNRFNTSYGEFGVMVNFAYSRVKTESDGTQLDRIYQFTNPSMNGGNPVWLPDAGDVRKGLYTRDRVGGAGALQWQNPSHTLVATVQFNISNYRSSLAEYGVVMKEYGQDRQTAAVPLTGPQLPAGLDNAWIQPAPGTTATFFTSGPYKGLLKSGYLSGETAWQGTNASSDWLDAASVTHHYFNQCLPWDGPWDGCDAGNPRFRRQTSNSNESRYWDNKEVTQDLSANVKWDPSANLHFNIDAQWVHASKNNYDITAALRGFELVGLDLSGSKMKWLDGGLGAGMAIDLKPGGWTKLGNYFPEYVMDHIDQDKGNEFSYRIDGQYDIGSTWLQGIKVGVRWADRHQEDNISNWNWQGVRAEWLWYNPGQPFFADTLNSRYFTTINYGSGFMSGNVFPAVNLPFVSMDTLVDKNKIWSMASVESTGFGYWHQDCDRPDEVPGSCFRRAEMLNLSETTWAGYAMLKFGGPDAKIFGGLAGVSGNIGVRVVNTITHSTGGTVFPQPFVAATTPPTPPQIDPYTLIPQSDKDFSNSAQRLLTARKSIVNVLPSLNVRFDLPSDWVVRFAASRAMSRPDIGLMRNYMNISGSYPSGIYTAGSPPITVIYQATAGNPYLKPMYADNIDLSIERYFSSVGSFSFDIFFKQFHDYINYGHYLVNFTNNGATKTVDVQAPVNGKGGSLKGFEVAYTRYLDFLPDPWSGFGIQANFVALHNNGLSNAGVYNNGGNGEAGSASSRFRGLPLEGLATLSGNLVALYERGPFAARLAYDWRNKYMISMADCCIKTDIWQRPYGQFDGSVSYRVGDHWEFGVQGSNLLGQQVVLEQQVSANPKVLMPRSWFQTDRRIEVSARMKY